jgi:hypothetical protein
VSRSAAKQHLCIGLVVLMAGLLLFGCAAAEPRPSGVSWRVTFFVLSVYPKSFEITAVGPRSLPREELKEAWLKKAKLVANGRRFKTAPLVIHENETVASGTWPIQSRSVTGTITLLD